ncbi:glycoside hydrolase family 5 protein [Hespellia stercorisuis]|uniref:Exo-1,3-beta-glucanase D n=1 Tax=Hespellia stercorisuis DSM 15480 TaxID=1121950 RepID=A0A1M6Q9Q1_9FIRM|nr:cellulase family glycosylhydrolase [Hespellia stercorisuis]SHK17014.1 Cellulase (glycosyl hydrolase family 5) [Hespellia stercorisuis DSM 15480]
MQIKGVNLGNWLVLEKWMSPALFEGTTAEDEYYLPTQLSKEVYEARIKVHRSEYITERDFAIIKSHHMNAVRIPVPYFIFGDCPPFLGCIEELDKAFGWAEKYGLQILIDLHTVPGSQNGFDNGGISGVCTWAQDPKKVEFTLELLEKLARRYGTRAGLLGIEIVNEPLTAAAWDSFNIQERYKPVDEALGKQSRPVEMAFLRNFYVDAYRKIRKYMPVEKSVVIHDGFDFLAWKDFMQETEFENVILDTHQYLMMAEMAGCAQSVEGYVNFVKENYEEEIKEMSRYFPVICGEWCLFNSYACGHDTKGGQSVLNGMEGVEAEAFTMEEKKVIYQELAKAQLQAWNAGNGYFYWNYKLLLDTVSESSWIGWDAWDFDKCVAQGWFPVEHA